MKKFILNIYTKNCEFYSVIAHAVSKEEAIEIARNNLTEPEVDTVDILDYCTGEVLYTSCEVAVAC